MIKDPRQYKILVIEDNLGDYSLIEEYLEDYIQLPQIVNARNYKEALAILSDEDKDFDIVLLDLSLPDKYGESLIKEITGLSKNTPVLVLTGFTDINFGIQSISMGISDYLLKDDLNAAVLYKSILYALERKKAALLITQSEKRYSDLFQLSPQPMWLYELETLKFVQINKAATEKYGYTEEEFLQMTILDIRPDSELKRTKEGINRRIAGETDIFGGVYKHQTKSGEEVYVEIYSTPIEFNNKRCRSVIAIDITERLQIEDKVTRAIIKTQEDERYEIGSELHDNVCQILATSQMYLDIIQKHINEEAKKHFFTTKDLIHMATDEIRNLSHRLAPVFFEDSTFKETIANLLDKNTISKDYSISLHFAEEVDSLNLNADIKLNLYRILQEMLRNTLKYAKATEIKIEFYLQHNNLIMELFDNGIGFTYALHKSGIGLANMKRRAELFGGTFQLETAPDKGCRITVQVPVEKSID